MKQEKKLSASKRYWVIVASKDHVEKGVEGGFCQANHGKKGPLLKMHRGDWVVFYSPKLRYGGQEPCQEFTAVGEIAGDKVFQYQMSPDFAPYRREVNFKKSLPVDIRPLIPELEFIENPQSWGYKFRFGFFEINEHDFKLIAGKMLRESM